MVFDTVAFPPSFGQIRLETAAAAARVVRRQVAGTPVATIDPVEYLPVVFYAVIFFVAPVAGGLWLWWAWRRRQETRRSEDQSKAA
jgi:hypothetical protein